MEDISPTPLATNSSLPPTPVVSSPTVPPSVPTSNNSPWMLLTFLFAALFIAAVGYIFYSMHTPARPAVATPTPVVQTATSTPQPTDDTLPVVDPQSEAKAEQVLLALPEIQVIKASVEKAGNHLSFTPEHQSNDAVRVDMGEVLADHVSSIDTFDVNIVSGEVLVLSKTGGEIVSYADWAKTIPERFP